MEEEKHSIEMLGITHTFKEWYAFADELDHIGESSFAMRIFFTLYKLAPEGSQYKRDCATRVNKTPTLEAHYTEYKSGGATDLWNRNPNTWVHDSNAPVIFDERLDEGKIYHALRGINFTELKERKYWFVIKRVFDELNWLKDSKNTHFADWVGVYFQWPWDRKNPWRKISETEPQIIKTPSWQWNEHTVPDSDVGKHYATMARMVWDTFTEIPKITDDDNPKDMSYFYLPYKILINDGT